MRNLRLSSCSVVSDDALRGVRLFCVDPDTNDCFYLTDDTTIRQLTCRNQDSYTTEVTAYCDSNVCSKEIISLDYLNDQRAISLVTEDGDLVLCSDENFEVIGSVDSGFRAASWSPDGDILLLVTGSHTIIAMTREFDQIREVDLFSDDFGEGKPVTVGWGKKETQFHASMEKSANKMAPSLDTPLSDDGKTRLSWRGDGQFFAVNAISPVTGQRSIYVFSRDCTLMYSSESIPGLESQIGWKPIGSVIASVQRLPNKYQIIFLEKNGLQHGEFTISSATQQYIIRNLSWSCDSNLLAVWIEEFSGEERAKNGGCSKLQIWMVNNYHWYLKQTLDFAVDDPLVSFAWHPERASTLHCFTVAGRFIRYSWEWTTDRSLDGSEFDEAVVGVIDSNKILTTPFKQMIVPPPQSAYEIILPLPANQICFPRNHSPGKFIIVLSDYRVVVVSKEIRCEKSSVNLSAREGQGFNRRLTPHSIEAIYTSEQLANKVENQCLLPLSFHHWLWLTPELIINVKNEGGSSSIMQYSLQESSRQLKFEGVTKMDGIVHTLTASSEASTAIVQSTDGSVQKYSPFLEASVFPWIVENKPLQFPQVCHAVETCSINEQELIFGLSHRLRLYCLNNELFSNCVSFILHDNFLLLTTNDHTLHAIPLNATLLTKTSDFKNESLRKLERGSRIVTCIRDGTQLILQMPRGNLEGIHPRALTLSLVSKYLNELNFFEAFVLMKKHRINMNLLFDHNPKNFLENVNKFISQIDNINWINLFLTDLQDENVTATLYTTSYDEKIQSSLSGKVNTVHSAVRRALTQMDSQKFLLPILTTYVMSKPPNLEAALNLIKNVDKKEKDEALSYMQYLTDINQMYDVALGTYDFDLVIMVAQKSQKDPKEYLPTLNQLRKMEVNYQRFSIDCKLQKYEKALEHIVKCGDRRFDECLKHICTHNLYIRALQLMSSDDVNYRKVIISYAQYLNDAKKYEEAGLWFERGGETRMAIEAYRKGLHWTKALTLATDVPFSPNEFSSLAEGLTSRLKDERCHAAAARIQEHYLNNPKESIVSLIEGRQWQTALEMIYRYKCKDLIDTRMKPAVRDHCKSLTSSSEQKKALIIQYASRLKELRQEKKDKLLQSNDNVDNDLASDVESTITWSTQQSSRSCSSRQTSRNRRKQERKKQSLKKGNPFEENALIEACNELYNEGDKMREECASVLWFSLSFGFDRDAEELQKSYDEFLRILTNHKDDIWCKNDETSVNTQLKLGPDSTVNSIVESKMLATNTTNGTNFLVAPKLRENVKWKLDCFL